MPVIACPHCGNTNNIIGVEYDNTHPEHYDGVSEYHCGECKTRWGRWTGSILQEGESELRYGSRQSRA